MAQLTAPKIVSSRSEFADSHTMSRYLATGGFSGLKKALTMNPEDVAAEVDAASLLGRGAHQCQLAALPAQGRSQRGATRADCKSGATA